MAQSINLIPQQEVQAQFKTRVVKMSTWISILVLVAVGAVAGYYFYRTTVLKNQISTLETSIEKQRMSIRSMESIEILARTLDTKYQALKTIFGTQPLYSRLLKDMDMRRPTTISINEINLNGSESFSVSGQGNSYIAISKFVTDLTSTQHSSSSARIFQKVDLNSVSLVGKTNKATFLLNVTYDPSQLLLR